VFVNLTDRAHRSHLRVRMLLALHSLCRSFCQNFPCTVCSLYILTLLVLVGSPALIVERKEGLEQYMKALAKDPEILKCRVLREFIETPDVCSPEQHKEFDFGRR